MKVKVARSCPALCNPMDYTVHGILQARILEWVAFPFSRGLLHCRWILYQLSYQGRPELYLYSNQFSPVAQSCLPLCDPMDCSTPGFHVQLLEFTQTHVHCVGDVIQPSHTYSVIPFSSSPQSFPASGCFQISQFFTSGGQSIGASAST